MTSYGTPFTNDMVSFEPLVIERDGDHDVVTLPALSADQVAMIDPLVPPTSGIRLEIIERDGETITCPASKYTMFLRLFKAISEVMHDRLGRQARILVASDERPSSDRLVLHAVQVLAFDGHAIHVQHDRNEDVACKTFTHSGLSTPYASACLALFPDLDAVIMVTASHNGAQWNGVKFYFQDPVPIAGDLMHDISTRAPRYEKVSLKDVAGIVLHGNDHQAVINAYVRDVVSSIIPVTSLAGTPVVLWSYMGRADGIDDLLRSLGVNVVNVSKTMEPPDPTVNFPEADVKQHLLDTGARLAILLDADRDRIVFYLNTGDTFVKLNPNELYTSMHNLLATRFGKTIINVRTVPSDPRCDDSAACTIESGVGYKHLGTIQFLACNRDVDASQVSSSLIYGKDGTTRVKLDTADKLRAFLNAHVKSTQATGPMLMVLWEESGGHTVNLVTSAGGNQDGLVSTFPLIGDKFPAPAIVLLAELVARGFSLLDAIDTSITGIRVEVPADDTRKKAIMNAFEARVGETIDISGKSFTIQEYRDNNGLIDIISFVSETSIVFARPSGTGSSVRVYLFGDAGKGTKELDAIARMLEQA